jgi:type I restriction enzyme S subunit
VTLKNDLACANHVESTQDQTSVRWSKKRLKHVAHFMYGESLSADSREDGEFVVFGSNGPIGVHSSANSQGKTIVIGRKGSFGKVTWSSVPCFCIDTTFFIDRRSTQSDLEWLFYCLQTLGLNEISQDTGVPGLSREKAYESTLAYPPIPTQRAIANFLDRKTAAIDRLIAAKERLIALLAEKRQALITRAVTRGLVPNVPLKDSGIPWLGMIPEHWEVKKLGHSVEISGGLTPDRANLSFWDGKIPWVSPKDMKVPVIRDSIDHVTEAAIAETSLKIVEPPAVLFVVRGMILLHTVPVALTAAPVTVNQDMKALHPITGLIPEYLAHLLRATNAPLLALVEESGHGTRCLKSPFRLMMSSTRSPNFSTRPS